MSEVTQVLLSLTDGKCRAEELLPLVYNELRRLAAQQLSLEKPGRTLQATALVHEAWLRLVGSDPQAAEQKWEGRRHFFAAAAQSMRHILVERARRRNRAKHGAGMQRVDIEKVELAEVMPPEDLLALDEAFASLEEFDPQAAELVKLRFFAGFTQQQAAELVGVSKRTADRLWAFARAFMYKQIREGQTGGR
jgi:RNA polymerase sigma factor (TIGR02999 family)